MSLHRKQIRAAIVDKLSGETDAGTRVYPTRVKPVWNSEYPLILVNTNSEAVEKWASGPEEYKRTLVVEIQIMTEAVTDGAIDDTLDTVGAQVEAAIYANEYVLYNDDDEVICDDVMLKGSEIVIDKEGDRLFGSLSLTYEVVYYTQPVNDVADLEWLNRVDTTYDFSASGADPIDTLSGLSAL